MARFRKRAPVRRRRPLRSIRPVRRYARKKVTNMVHRFVRWADRDTNFPVVAFGPSNILEVGVNQNFSYSFSLRNLVNGVDFISLYDMYRINKVTIYLERNAGFTGFNNAANRSIRVIHDYNDNNQLTQEDDYLEYSNCKSYPSVGMRPIVITLYPKVAQVVENVGGTQGFNAVPSNKLWLNTTDDQIPHFGIKVFVPANIGTVGANIFTVRVKFHLSFKNSK